MTRNQLALSFTLLVLAGTLVVLAAESGEAKGAVQTLPSHFADLKVSSTNKVVRNTVTIVLAVRSMTDMPVPNVRVVIGLCAEGQQTPFRHKRTRRLDPLYEHLRPFNNGRKIEWWLQSAPANTEAYHKLKLKFILPLNKGGPTFCITAAAYTPYDTGPVPVRTHSVPLQKK